MPWMKNGKRDFRKEYAKYQGTPEQIANRAKRNAVRAEAVKAGVAKKGDGKDLDHKKPLSKGGSNSLANARMTTPAANRSFARNANGSLKSQTSKREKKK